MLMPVTYVPDAMYDLVHLNPAVDLLKHDRKPEALDNVTSVPKNSSFRQNSSFFRQISHEVVNK